MRTDAKRRQSGNCEPVALEADIWTDLEALRLNKKKIPVQAALQTAHSSYNSTELSLGWAERLCCHCLAGIGVCRASHQAAGSKHCGSQIVRPSEQTAHPSEHQLDKFMRACLAQAASAPARCCSFVQTSSSGLLNEGMCSSARSAWSAFTAQRPDPRLTKASDQRRMHRAHRLQSKAGPHPRRVRVIARTLKSPLG